MNLKLTRLLKIILITMCCFAFIPSQSIGSAVDASSILTWGPYRGVTTHLNISEQDIADLVATGANLVRLTAAKFPLMEKQAPYLINMQNVARMDQIIYWCEKYGLHVVIDPHTFPGNKLDTTTLANDPFWKSYDWHSHAIRLWDFLAQHYQGFGEVIAGYDLLNEPAIPNSGQTNSPADWNKLSRALVATIRNYDLKRPIIIEPARLRDVAGNKISSIEGIAALVEPFDKYLIYSPHIYEPLAFTHQGLKNRPKGVAYPGIIEGRYWDKKNLQQLLQPIRDFQEKYNVPIYIGEFSASIWGGASADRYLQDLIDIFEEYGWSWTYHAYRVATPWDAEKTADSYKQRLKEAPRLKILKAAFAKNSKESEH